MASWKHFWKLCMAAAGREMPSSMPPRPLRPSATAMAPVLATDMISTLAGRPNPKSTSYTRNLGDPATVHMPAMAASLNLSNHNAIVSGDLMPRTASSIAAATAVHATKRPPAPASTSLSIGAACMAPPTQLPRYSSGTGGFIRARWSTGKTKYVGRSPPLLPASSLARW
ncbi:hypothetical protein VPH35_067269 [Triticum aestivum]